jgi:Ketopantoate reductase PanE/ApbA
MTVAGIGSSAVKAGQHRKNPPVIVIGREEVQRGEDCGVVLNDHPFANHKSLRNGGVRASPQLSDFSSTDRFRIKSIGAERIVSLRILVLGAGVIGSVYAGKLEQKGHEVVLLARGRCA